MMNHKLCVMDDTNDNAAAAIVLKPLCLCETRRGDMAHAVGRVAFRPGRPMLVEHVGGLYLLHDLAGRVLSPGYGRDHDITYVY